MRVEAMTGHDHQAARTRRNHPRRPKPSEYVVDSRESTLGSQVVTAQPRAITAKPGALVSIASVRNPTRFLIDEPRARL